MPAIMKQKLSFNQNNGLFDFNFDSIADFNNYFPNNNAKIVVSKLKFMDKQKKRLKWEIN